MRYGTWIVIILYSLGHDCGRRIRERDHFQDLGVSGRIILRWIFKKWDNEP